MENRELNLLLEVFKQVRDRQLRWVDESFLLTNDNCHISLTSNDDTIPGWRIDQFLQAAMALDVSYYFEIFEGKIRVVFH